MLLRKSGAEGRVSEKPLSHRVQIADSHLGNQYSAKSVCIMVYYLVAPGTGQYTVLKPERS
jgi:hypothetical protein